MPTAPKSARVRAASGRPKAAGIVSSSHLVSPQSVELSEFEFGLIVAWNAFSRWACAAWPRPAAPS